MTTDERSAQARKLQEEGMNKTFEFNQMYNTDLVEVSFVNSCCSECAKYRARIYSISGEDKRFPKYPDWLKDHLCEHNCGIATYSYIEGFSEPTYITGDIFEASNRPFIDDRTPEQIRIFEERKAKVEKERLYRAEYAKLTELLPDAAPKSLAAYSRMKNSQSKGYLALKEKAKNVGLEI